MRLLFFNITAVICLCLLGGCGSQNIKASDSGAVTAGLQRNVSPSLSAKDRLQKLFLDQAEQAFAQARYTQPDHDNAYDKFHAVLIINPDNQIARSGLQAILIRYTEMIRRAYGQSQYSLARSLMAQAEAYYPSHPLLVRLKKEINTTKAAAPRKVKKKGNTGNSAYPEVKLSAELLGRRAEAVRQQLAGVAKRIESTDESVMIYARTDAEGRWIYKQLKQAVPGYRVRGDIRLAKRAKITILPPL